VNNLEGFRLCTALTAMEINTNAIFINDGVYALVMGQRTENIGLPCTELVCKKLTSFGINVYVLKEALKKRGINQKDLTQVNCKFIDRIEMAKIISKSNHTITV
jgi:sulfur relay (sulfurtransferase) DsrF/TusC family protein